VLDKGAASSQRALAELENPSTRENLLRYAMWRTRDYDKAKDLLADAMVLVLDPDRKPWDNPKISFRRHMRGVMDDVGFDLSQKASERREINETDLIAETGDADAFPDPADDRPGPDEVLEERSTTQWLRGLWQRMVPLFRGTDEVCLRIYDAACKSQETPQEQADFLGVPVEEVYEALRRMKYRAAIVKAEWQEEEAERMLRARTRVAKGDVTK
jgi:DNA-directed RNA polymerase specialized sigma24 family protein